MNGELISTQDRFFPQLIGFENLTLVQKDILCLCEAAQIPVILATQVLETLAKSGLPTRAEITDVPFSV